jgi:hypothetical protein
LTFPFPQVKQGFFNGVQNHVVSGTLQSGTEWFVQTPVWITLKEGIVIDVQMNTEMNDALFTNE